MNNKDNKEIKMLNSGNNTSKKALDKRRNELIKKQRTLKEKKLSSSNEKKDTSSKIENEKNDIKMIKKNSFGKILDSIKLIEDDDFDDKTQKTQDNIERKVNQNYFKFNTYEKEEEEKNYIHYKFRLLQIENEKKKLQWKLMPFIISLFLTFSSMQLRSFFYNTNTIDLKSSIIYILEFIFVSFCIYLLKERYFNMNEDKYKEKVFEYEFNNIQEKVNEDIFENSIKMSYKYLDQYYSQTRQQAEKGFQITTGVSITGGIIIVVGIIMMFIGKTTPAYLTSAAGVITEFISAIFFYLYNKTITSMSNYHNKLVISHNISIALKVAESLPSHTGEDAKKKIIDELIKNINSYLINQTDKSEDKN